jgi:NADH-quinone oxidoreductase subunit G
VLDTLAVEMDADLFTQTPAAAAADLARLGEGVPSGSSLNVAAPLQSPAGAGKAVLATWHRLIGNGSLQVDEPHLAGTARPVVAKVAEVTAQQFGLETGGHVTVSTERGAITLPVETDDLPEGVIWLPTNSGDVTVRATLGAGHGSIVSVSGGTSFGVKS